VCLDRWISRKAKLDINPEWVPLDIASHPGGSLRTAVPGQWRPADRFILGWTRDFFTVLSRWQTPRNG